MKTPTASPFPSVARPARQRLDIDPAMLKVEHDTPLPRFRSRTSDKYGKLFGSLKPGSCIRCEPSETPRISAAVRKALDLKKYPAIKGCKVVSRTKCADGHGRVWVMLSES